ncbi:piggyBac transposable element-derived protein 4-like [Hydra vulgaris]|uniref:PiggyBac transposable element-derived protein 4-like n=1 Tax=Hydra vulgaris TaxID=6087 RepID=A0ABM4BUV3_HYDVU
MGIVHKPNLNMYWSTDDLYWTPIFSKTMSRDRFKVILKFLHFNNNNDPNLILNDPNRDRLHKVRPFVNMIRERCRKVYSPGQHLSVDESLVLFKDRLHFCQYIKTKRARFGIKVYELTTADGITLDFLAYCGTGMYDDDKNSTMPLSQRIPIELMGPFLNKGHIVFTDNYYTSPSLASYLLSKKTYICGTICANRKHYSKEILNDQLAKGTAVFYKTRNEDNKMLACKYRATKDKSGNKQKVVYMLSTYHNPVMVETGKSDKMVTYSNHQWSSHTMCIWVVLTG